MKNKLYRISGLLFLFLALFSACEKEDMVSLPVEMSTWKNDNITSTSAKLSGYVVARGEGFTEQGVCYGTTEGVTVDNNTKVATEVENAIYWVTIDELEHLTTYYYRAYVKDNSGAVLYGKESSFSTLAHTATVDFKAEATATELTTTSVKLTANVPYDGKSSIAMKGVCYSRSEAPTVDDSKVEAGEGVGAFTVDLTNLWSGATYYAKAYAVNGIGTAYSEEFSFDTPPGLGIVATGMATNIEKFSATFVAEIFHDGGAELEEVGFVYGFTLDPTVEAATKLVSDNATVGALQLTATDLVDGAKYFVRAYAKNEHGIAYGENQQFTTVSDILTWFIPGDYIEASYKGTELVNWNPGLSPTIQNTKAAGGHLEGYVYMANATNAWKFATGEDWNPGPNYGVGEEPGKLSDAPDATNISSESGYYLIQVDKNAETGEYSYSATKTSWGVIGSGTPGGWDADTDLAYNPKAKVWSGAVHLGAEGEYKFRANDGWDLNYGGDVDALSAGGDNMKVSGVEADYMVTLDLSQPNAYTCSVHRWGLIGSATPGSWDNDTDMSWDATNKVFTVTLDLVEGEIKYRADDGWDVNLGGDLNALTPGGDNLVIEEAGSYTITLDPIANMGSVTKN